MCEFKRIQRCLAGMRARPGAHLCGPSPGAPLLAEIIQRHERGPSFVWQSGTTWHIASCGALYDTAGASSTPPACMIPPALASSQGPSSPPSDPCPPSKRTDQVDGGHSTLCAIGELLRKTPTVPALPRVRSRVGQAATPAEGQPDHDACAAWHRAGRRPGVCAPHRRAHPRAHAGARLRGARSIAHPNPALTLVLGDGQDGKGVVTETQQASGLVRLERAGAQTSSADSQAHISTTIVHRKHTLLQRLVSPHAIAALCVAVPPGNRCLHGERRPVGRCSHSDQSDPTPRMYEACTDDGCSK